MTETLKCVLWLAIEDYSGLWEVLWELHSRFPKMSDNERVLAGREAIRELYARGWIEIYKCAEPGGKLESVSRNEVEKVIAEPVNWQEPAPGSTSIRVGSTPAGEKELSGRCP